MGPHRRVGHRRRTRDERDNLGHRHEPVGIRAFIAITGQPALPVRRQQPQRIPALVAPGIGHLPAFEHDVIDRALAEAMARRQSGVSGADDDRGDGFDGALASWPGLRPGPPPPLFELRRGSPKPWRRRRLGRLRGPHAPRRSLAGAPCAPSRGRAYTTSTVTLVGLVTISNTAERFCDCATSASMSFFDASASMLNVTLISS